MSVSNAREIRYPVVWFPVTATGTKTLPRILEPGEWRVTTDTVQAFTSVQFVLNSATTAATFGVVIRGGIGTVSLTEGCDEVALSTGTFPLLLGFERLA